MSTAPSCDTPKSSSAKVTPAADGATSSLSGGPLTRSASARTYGASAASSAIFWESQYFTEQEQAALALAEEVTRLSVPERHEWDNASLNDDQVSAISWLAIVMNAWNRIAIRSHYPVGP